MARPSARPPAPRPERPRRDGDGDVGESPHASKELLRARELLADGRWHDYETVMRELVKVITPGRAGRAAESARRTHARRRAQQRGEEFVAALPRLRPADPDRVRETGARLIVRKMITASDFEVDYGGRPVRKRIRYPRSAPTRRYAPPADDE